MKRFFSTITTTLILGLSSIDAYATEGWYPGKFACEWFGIGCDTGGGHSVPELSVMAGPVAVAVILGIVGIGLERRRRNNKK